LVRTAFTSSGEDVAEIHLHGSQAIVTEVLNTIVKNKGVRLAEPGEFTKRAFLNNKIDLTQAEAVAELIASKNRRSATLASTQLNGSLSKLINSSKEKIVSLSAYYVANLDFSEEDVASIKSSDSLKLLSSVKSQIKTILNNTANQHIIKDGIKIALIGLPNAGKSSLLNNLLGFERAIVSNVAGTTRDIIAESITIDGVNCVITDTAGLRESKNQVEKIGINLTQQEITASDFVMVLIEPDMQAATQDYLLENNIKLNLETTCIIFSKDDIAGQKPNKFFKEFNNISISNKNPKSIQNVFIVLKNLTKELEIDSIQSLTDRQKRLLNNAVNQIDNISKLIKDNIADDIVLVDIQELIETFNLLNGESSTEDMITEVFSKFCIGK
jgi:tRNA modification GTPase